MKHFLCPNSISYVRDSGVRATHLIRSEAMADKNDPQMNCEGSWSQDENHGSDGEYALNPTGNEEDGWDYGDASPDDDLDNADWPKRTPDTMAALEAQVAISPRRLLFLRGSCWYVWLDYRTLEWTTDSEDAVATKGMLSKEFPPSVIQNRGETDEAISVLYKDAATFLQKAGVKTAVLG